MQAFFSELIPQDVREDYLTSVAPASQQDVYAQMGVAEQTAWSLGSLPEGWIVKCYDLEVSDYEATIGVHTAASNQLGLDIYLEQQHSLTRDDFVAYEKAELEIGGISVVCYTAQTGVEGEPRRQETWCFHAPDGKAELQLTFSSADGTELPKADKLTVFRGFQQTTVQNLDISELNHQK